VSVNRPSERQRLLVVAALIRDDDKFLLSRRREDQTFPLHWEFPGGKVEPGEAPEVALIREIREELGCSIRVGKIEEVVFHAYDTFDLYMLLYDCAIESGVPKAVEVQRVAWVEAAQLTHLELPPADRPLAKRLSGNT